MKSPELGVNQMGLELVLQIGALAAAAESQANDEEQIDPNTQSRFSKLILIDQEYAKYKQKDYCNTFELPEFCYRFRNFAASKLKLYYSEKNDKIIRISHSVNKTSYSTRYFWYR